MAAKMTSAKKMASRIGTAVKRAKAVTKKKSKSKSKKGY
jgi:hypothetical protein|tara:strand:+ start:745 stop:861 length:117 start_codon:yes stop_codon:yes gene_type:complete